MNKNCTAPSNLDFAITSGIHDYQDALKGCSFEITHAHPLLYWTFKVAL